MSAPPANQRLRSKPLYRKRLPGRGPSMSIQAGGVRIEVIAGIPAGMLGGLGGMLSGGVGLAPSTTG